MNYINTYFFLVISFIGIQVSSAQTIAIKAGYLINPSDNVIAENQIILVRDRKIIEVGNVAEAEYADEIIDLSTSWVLPGLMDCHVHLTANLTYRQADLYRMYVTESNAFRALRGARNAALLLQGGFTTVKEIGNDGDYAMADVIKAIRSGWIEGPTIQYAGKIIAPYGGQLLGINPQNEGFWSLEFIDADTHVEIRKAIRKNIYNGASTIKIVAGDHPGDGPQYFYSQEDIAIAVDEAKRAGLRVSVHTNGAEVHMSGATGEAPDLLTYKKKLAEGEMIGPQLFTTGPILDGDPPIFGGVSIAISSTEEARRIVREQKQKGYDFIKVYNNLTPDLLKVITDEAKTQDISVIGHIPRQGGRDKALQRALDAGMDMIAHGEEYFFTFYYNEVDSLLNQGKIPYPDEKKIPFLVKLTKEADVAVTPNLSFVAMTRMQLDSLGVVLSDPETRYLSREVLEMWEEQNPTNRSDLERFNKREIAKYDLLKKFTKALEEGGITILLGTDASAPGLFPGKSAHIELHELVKAGLTPYEALSAGTYNAGKFMNQHVTASKPFGIIKAGYQADLILVKGNSLENISNVSKIMGVMEGGEWFSSAELTQMRNNIAQKYDH